MIKTQIFKVILAIGLVYFVCYQFQAEHYDPYVEATRSYLEWWNYANVIVGIAGILLIVIDQTEVVEKGAKK